MGHKSLLVHVNEVGGASILFGRFGSWRDHMDDGAVTVYTTEVGMGINQDWLRDSD